MNKSTRREILAELRRIGFVPTSSSRNFWKMVNNRVMYRVDLSPGTVRVSRTLLIQKRGTLQQDTPTEFSDVRTLRVAVKMQMELPVPSQKELRVRFDQIMSRIARRG